jgi:pimeloyl-ACP methyl ester carboxylesterase
MWAVAVVLGGVGLVGLSYFAESLRRTPTAPAQLSWAPDIAVQYVDVDGIRLRYVVAGDGEPVLLLHTLRTQLDMFQKVLPMLAGRFRVYAFDFPGHGYSDIPATDYTPELFVRAAAGFLERLGIENAVVAGESIGGSVALLLAARGHPRVRAVVAVNPYDYDGGRGLRRASPLANVLFGVNDVPVVGGTVTRLRAFPIVKRVFEGGVHDPSALPRTLSREMYRVGNRPGHYRALMSLVHHWGEWEQSRSQYPAIASPVELVYGEYDWSTTTERDADARDIPGAHMLVVPDSGHFLSLDAPGAFAHAVLRAAAR